MHDRVDALVEAGVDGLTLRSVTCNTACVWDLDGSSDVGSNARAGVRTRAGTAAERRGVPASVLDFEIGWAALRLGQWRVAIDRLLKELHGQVEIVRCLAKSVVTAEQVKVVRSDIGCWQTE